MDYDTLRALIDEFETFEKETGQRDMATFAIWLSARRRPLPAMAPGAVDYPLYGGPDSQLAQAVSGLYQHARHYVKTGLQDLPLKGLYDFTFLATLVELGDQRKSDLIALNMQEYSPGMEVVRRLLRHGLIEDYEDPADARSRRVRITPQGRAVFEAALPRMHQAVAIVGGNLGDEEKQQFLVLAKKLLHFHRPIWENALGRPLTEIIDTYLEKPEEKR